MPKKTARAARPSQQRSKEEQWRRRVAGQTRPGTASAVAEPAGVEQAAIEDDTLDDEAITPVATAQTAAAPRSTTTTKISASTQRRATATGTSSYSQRSARSRLAATTMSVEDEMLYIKADIRKLVLLTGFCLLLLIALAFVLPMVMS